MKYLNAFRLGCAAHMALLVDPVARAACERIFRTADSNELSIKERYNLIVNLHREEGIENTFVLLEGVETLTAGSSIFLDKRVEAYFDVSFQEANDFVKVTRFCVYRRQSGSGTSMEQGPVLLQAKVHRGIVSYEVEPGYENPEFYRRIGTVIDCFIDSATLDVESLALMKTLKHVIQAH